jgi:anti-sigma regulatory factor (Ser/Thr protein kinase)
MPERPSQTLLLQNDLAEIPRLAGFIDEFCRPLGPTEEGRQSLHLALEEAVANVIEHGYRDGARHVFSVELTAAPAGRVTVVLTDDAPAFDPLARPPVDTSRPLEEREIGGLGVHLVRQLAETASYEYRDGRNILTLVLAVGSGAERPSS